MCFNYFTLTLFAYGVLNIRFNNSCNKYINMIQGGCVVLGKLTIFMLARKNNFRMNEIAYY